MSESIPKRHAYLIMAHNEPEVLARLLTEIDDPRNDIFLHLDTKFADISQENLERCVRRSSLHFLPRTNVRWGSYSQIKCMQRLLESAVQHDDYAYCHFLVGTEFPLKSQDYIHNFFAENAGKEFIGYDASGEDHSWRMRYYFPFPSSFRPSGRFDSALAVIRRMILVVEKAMRVNRLDCCTLAVKKGNANWSITGEAARYLVETLPRYERMIRHTYCADEVIFHTLIYNSSYSENIFDITDEYHSNMRVVQWANSDNRYTLEDYPFLADTDALFARKIYGSQGLSLIDKLLSCRDNNK